MRKIPDILHPEAVFVSGSKIARDWWAKLDEIVKAIRLRVPLTGQVTFAAATTAAVTFTDAEPDTNYLIHVDAPEDRRTWITSKATTGFTLNVSATSSATYGWTLVRL